MEITYFNRHESMDSKTREMVLDTIREIRYSDVEKSTFTIENYLYGFFDGYDYSKIIPSMEIMEEIKSKNNELYKSIMDLCKTIQSYPRTKEPNNNNF
jgi:hypothetical protein